MEICFRCDRSEKEVKLLDAIYGNDIIKVCERCSLTENIPIIKKPTTSQLRESEKAFSVYQRLKKMAGLVKEEKKIISILDQIRKLDEHPELEIPEEKKPFNLIDNFHWHVQRARRNRGLSQRQLAWAIGESEAAIKMLEKGELPEEPEKFIRKLEQFFQIKIRERTEQEAEEEKRKREEKAKEKYKLPVVEVEKELEFEEPIKPITEEEKIDELELITKEKLNLEEEKEAKEKPSPAKVLSFKPEILESITIADLQKMKEEQEREEILAETEEKRKKVLEEERKKELKEKIAEEMKELALGKREREETIREKREILNNALRKISKTEEISRVPTLAELAEKKKEKERKKQIQISTTISELQEKKVAGERELTNEEQIEIGAEEIIAEAIEEKQEEMIGNEIELKE